MQASAVTVDSPSGDIFRLLDMLQINPRTLIFSAVSLAGLYYAHLYSFLLFHVLIEIFSVLVAFTIFMFV